MSKSISWKNVGIAAGATLVGNLVIFAAGSAAGASWEVGQPQPVSAAAVVASSIMPFLVATVIYNRISRLQLILPVGGLVFAVISAPGGYLASQEVATGVALGAMHLVAGLVWYRLTKAATTSN